MNCRHCTTPLKLPFVDLGSAPPSNAYLTADALNAPEKWYPLRVLVCTNCWLVQTDDVADAADLFDADYAYFSSYSASWLAHAERYVTEVTQRFNLTSDSHVVEVAANDGYLLQFVSKAGIPCTGIEPTAATAAAARQKQLPIIEEFFGVALARRLAADGLRADLMVANNVLAHVPDVNDFVAGFTELLKPDGVATFEFPHLLNLISNNQFDTIYHEHFSYLSLLAATRIFNANGLSVFDLEQLPTHGGSLRVFTQRSDSGTHPNSAAVEAVLAAERGAKLDSEEGYSGFQARAETIKNDFLEFLLELRRAGKTAAAYGAAAKGNTLLNFAGIRPDLLRFVVDRNPAKQGKWLPGSRIPIVDESALKDDPPDYLIILPWNLRQEIAEQLAYLRQHGGRFAVAVPQLETWS